MKHKKRKTGYFIIIIVILLVAGRIYLPYWVKNYVNRTLDNIDGYSGSISDVDLALWRGAYQIDDLILVKDDGPKNTPFLTIKKTDLSVEWRALFKGKVVAEVDLYSPEMNMVFAGTNAVQTGTDTDWTQAIKDLMPLDINRVGIHSGRINYKDFTSSPDINLYLSSLDATVTNLRNVEDENVALPSDIKANAGTIGEGRFTLDGKLNVLKKTPDFDLNMKAEGVALPSVNDFTNKFIGVDFAGGNLGIYSEIAAKGGQVNGYVKPVLTEVNMVDTETQDTNPFDVIWESIVSVFTE
ncbi:MAG: hypothetical protein CL565_04080, partial [Alphaproteobacteria bacterium]|nr:hypothetical protein [Alphaproteobacteria bacterium]